MAQMPHVYSSSREKRIDLWLGFGSWIVVAAVVLLVVSLVSPPFANQLGFGMLLPATAIVAVALVITRSYAGFGWLLAPAVVVALVVVETPFLLASLAIGTANGDLHTGYCDTVGGLCLGPPSTTIPLAIGFIVYLFAVWVSLRAIDRRVR